MWKIREFSIFEYVKEMYMYRGGNFIGYTVNGIIFTISNFIGFYEFWPMLFYSLGILMTYFAFVNVVSRIDKWELLLYIVTLYNLYVLTSVDFAVFTWLCAMSYYLFAPAVCLLLRLINIKHLSLFQRVVMICMALFIAGNAISISTITFVVLFVNGMFLWHKYDWNVKNTWEDSNVKRLLLVTFIMLGVFIIVVIAPGNYLRMADEFDIEQPASLFEFIVACFKCTGMYIYLTSFYLPYYIIVIVLGYIAGCKYSMNLKASTLILFLCVIYVVYLFVSVMPLAYLSNGFQIQRNYTQLTFFLILVLFSIGVLMGNGRQLSKTILMIGFISTTFLIVIVGVNIYQDIPVAVSYNNAHKERELLLLQLNDGGNTDTIIVEPFPSVHTPDAKYNLLSLFGINTSMPRIYYDSDTDIKPNEYESHIKRLFNLNFDFVLPSK